jgi:hypothetical protein
METMHTPYENMAWMLPQGMTWEAMSEAREQWDIDPTHTICARVDGVCMAWARPLASNYEVVL